MEDPDLRTYLAVHPWEAEDHVQKEEVSLCNHDLRLFIILHPAEPASFLLPLKIK